MVRLNEKELRHMIGLWEGWKNGENEEPPRGTFWCSLAAGGYMAVDNTTGECWIEEFEKFEDIRNWAG